MKRIPSAILQLGPRTLILFAAFAVVAAAQGGYHRHFRSQDT